MATSSPPSNAVSAWAMPPKAQDSEGAPLSSALDFIDTLRQQGIAFAPAMPEPESLIAAAQKADITPKQALCAYLAILEYE